MLQDAWAWRTAWRAARTMGVIAAVGLAGPARAGDVACIWSGLPPAYLEMLKAIDTDAGKRAFLATASGEDVLLTLVKRCGVRTAPQAKAAAGALVAYAEAAAAARVLQERYGVTQAQVDAAWLALPSAQRELLATNLITAQEGDPTDAKLRDASLPIIRSLAGQVGVTNRRPTNQIIKYLTMKAFQARYEAEF